MTVETYTRYQGLHCPRCGSDYLHQGRVTVFDRAEDAELTDVTVVEGGLSATHRVPSADTDNPSSRRHGLTIDFRCEECGDNILLRIGQHKGNTHMSWHYTAARPGSFVT